MVHLYVYFYQLVFLLDKKFLHGFFMLRFSNTRKKHLFSQILNCHEEENEGLHSLLGKKLEEEREQKKETLESDVKLKCTRSVLDAFKSVTVSDTLVDISLSYFILVSQRFVSHIIKNKVFQVFQVANLCKNRANFQAKKFRFHISLAIRNKI